MVELKFNKELSLFVEEEDPLQSSLHLEDLPSLQPSTSDSSSDQAAPPESPHCQTKLFLSFLMGDDEEQIMNDIVDSRYQGVLKEHGVSLKSPKKSKSKPLGCGMVYADEVDLYISLPAPPSLEIEEDIDDILRIDSSETEERYEPSSSLKVDVSEATLSPVIECSPSPHAKMKKLNALTSPAFLNRKSSQSRYKDLEEVSCTYQIPHTDIISTASMERKRISMDLKKRNYSTPSDADTLSTSSMSSVRSSHRAKSKRSSNVKKSRFRTRDYSKGAEKAVDIPGTVSADSLNLDLDEVSIEQQRSVISSSSRASKRLSKALTPNWLGSYKEKSRRRKNGTKVQNEKRTGRSSEQRKDDNEQKMIPSIAIENLDSLSIGFTSDNGDDVSHLSCASSVHESASTKVRNRKDTIPRTIASNDRSTSLPNTPRPSPLHRGNRAISDPHKSPSVARMRSGARSVITVKTPKKQLHGSNVSAIVRPRNDHDAKVSYRINHYSHDSDDVHSVRSGMSSGSTTPRTPRRGHRNSGIREISNVSPMVRPRYDHDAKVSYHINHYSHDSDDVHSARSGMSSGSTTPRTPRRGHRNSGIREMGVEPVATPSPYGSHRTTRGTPNKQASHFFPKTPDHSAHSFRWVDPPSTPSSRGTPYANDPAPSPYSVDGGYLSDATSTASSYTSLSGLSYKDPCAKPSRIVKRSNLDLSSTGDGDIWVEKIFVSKRTGKRRTFFVSVATGRRVRDEPPTGASKVLYTEDLKELQRDEERAQSEMKVPTFINLSSC